MERAIEKSDSYKPKINFDLLKKGSFISTAELEKAFEIKRTDRRWPFLLMHLRKEIIDQSQKNGTALLPKIENQALRILTDSEGSEYSINMMQNLDGRRAYWLKTARAAVDVAKLHDEERARFEREMECSARIQQHIRAERRKMISCG